MSGDERRNKIVERIAADEKPISATVLAGDYGVSRQVIVQDIALLRASGHNIVSTHRGYVIEGKTKYTRIYKVKHTDEEVMTELYAIVDMGGIVEDVFINHKVYGRVQASLNINSRKKVDILVQKIKSGKSSPLKNITSGYHYHTVSADSEEILGDIEDRLRELNFLIEK